MSYDPTQPDTAYPHPTTPTWDPRPTARTTPSNGIAIGGFVCALVGLVLAVIPFVGLVGFPVIVTGIVLSAIGLARNSNHRGLAIAGLVIALIALPLDAVITTAVLGHLDTATTAANSLDPSTPTSTAIPLDTLTSSSFSSQDQAFLQVLSDHGVTLGATDEQAVSFGHSVSHYLATGGTLSGAEQVLTDNGYSPYDAGVIVGDAVGAYGS